MSKLKDKESCIKSNSSTDDEDEDFLGFSMTEDASSQDLTLKSDVKGISNDEETLLCETCLKVYPLQCTTFDLEVYQLMKKKNCLNELIWRCQQCRNRSCRISNMELFELVNKMQTRLEKLEAGLKPIKVPVAKPILENVEPKITHQLIVTTNGKEPFTKQTFAEKVKENLRTVPVQNIKVAKDGYGIINFPNETSRDDGLLKLKHDFPVQPNNRPMRSVFPKITISNIDGSTYKKGDTEKLRLSIFEKNPTIHALANQGKLFNVLFIKEDFRQNDSSVAVVKVDKEVYAEIKALKYQLYIDFRRCQVSDRLHVTQCYQCQKFGHIKSTCSSAQPICRYCTEHHETKTCPHKGDLSKYKCANCGGNHTSTYIKCPILQKQAQSLINRTQGMETYVKNDLRPYVIVT